MLFQPPNFQSNESEFPRDEKAAQSLAEKKTNRTLTNNDRYCPKD
jgi:hypothetical protein